MKFLQKRDQFIFKKSKDIIRKNQKDDHIFSLSFFSNDNDAYHDEDDDDENDYHHHQHSFDQNGISVIIIFYNRIIEKKFSIRLSPIR